MAGLAAIGLAGVPDDGTVADIENPAFNTEDPGHLGLHAEGTPDRGHGGA
ncbi:MAG: hypothetical protein WDM84_05910 [Bauldia sp.]